ncbi:hypothetical protein EVA_14696 [gut metagenome]|uniref:Uncharacterized protein n=1 Tax=gut metagenome TaxID=749906 RepID=J9G5X2_9ZZZZ
MPPMQLPLPTGEPATKPTIFPATATALPVRFWRALTVRWRK